MSPWPWISSLGRASFEGSLLILVVWLVCRSWRNLPAWARSGLWWLASARLLVALTPWTALSVHAPLPAALPWRPAAISAPRSFVEAPRLALDPTPSTASFQRLEIRGTEPASPLTPSRPAGPRLPKLDARALTPLLFTVWAFGVLLRLLGLARSFARVRRMRRAAAPAGVELPALLAAGAGVRVALHREVPAPMVTGLWRPLVLLPAAMVDRPADDLRIALAHELSHVRRGDLWLAWVPALAEALFWFHPLVALCAREYVQACEEACDEDALRTTGVHPYDYGRLLLALGVDRRWAGAGAMPFGSPNPRQLLRRLSMLKHVGPLKPQVRTAALSVVCAFALLGLAPIHVVPAAARPAPRVARAPMPVSMASEALPAVATAPTPASAPVAAPASVAPAAPLTPEALAVSMEMHPMGKASAQMGTDNDKEGDNDADDDDSGDVDNDDDDDAPSVAPVPPVPPVPPIPPMPPMPPMPAMPHLPMAAYQDAERSHRHYAYSYDDDSENGFAYVLVQGDGESMNGSGNTADWKEVRKLRARLDGDFLWVRDGDRRFVIQDSDVLEKIEDAFAPQSEVGARQSKLGAYQSRIGDQQSKIGVQQSKIGEQQAEIGAQQAEVAMRMARRQARGHDTRDLERAADDLSDQMEALSRQQEKLSAQMEPYSRQQEELGSQMERLSRDMERASRNTSRQVRALIERAIEDGSAEPLR